jgi:hypothetical protein
MLQNRGGWENSKQLFDLLNPSKAGSEVPYAATIAEPISQLKISRRGV